MVISEHITIILRIKKLFKIILITCILLTGTVSVHRRFFQTAHFYIDDRNSPRVICDDSFPIISTAGESLNKYEVSKCKYFYLMPFIGVNHYPVKKKYLQNLLHRQNTEFFSFDFINCSICRESNPRMGVGCLFREQSSSLGFETTIL